MLDDAVALCHEDHVLAAAVGSCRDQPSMLTPSK
jgi:hypothetical protein